MLEKYGIGVSPLTGVVYLGKFLRPGVWSKMRKEITGDFIFCVLQKFGPALGQNEKAHTLQIPGQPPDFEIIVRRLPAPDANHDAQDAGEGR